MAKKKPKAAVDPNPANGVEASSEGAVLLVAPPAKEPSVRAPDIAALDERLNADPARMTRLAEANTKRLSGKPVL